MAEGAELRLRVLGAFAVERAGRPVAPAAFGGRLAQRLLRVLAVQRGVPVARDALVEVLWDGAPPSDPAANLAVLTSRIRRATGAPWLVVAAGTSLEAPLDGRCAVDGEAFEQGVEHGHQALRRGEAAAAARCYAAALGWWRGEPLVEDRDAEWARPYRDRLGRLRLEAWEGAAEAALELRDATAAVSHATAAAVAEPLRERSALLVLRALAAAGDAAGADGAYAAFRRRLAEEVGLDPSPHADELHRQLLRGALPVAGPRLAPAKPAQPDRAPLPFVGRDAELRELLAALRRHGGVAVVTGASGTGKSRLLAEAAARSTATVASARAFAAEAQIAGALLHRLLDTVPPRGKPVADDAADTAVRPDSRRALERERALRRLAAAVEAGLAAVVLDDLQWADATSLDALRHLHWRVPALRLVLAYRPEEVDDALGELLADLARGDHAVVQLELQALPPSAVTALVDDDWLGDVLREETDGTPIALHEVLAGLADAGHVTGERDGRYRATAERALGEDAVRALARAGQRRVVRRRLGRQPLAAQAVMEHLALLGRPASPQLLAAAAALPQAEVFDALDRLHGAGLARPGARGWQPAHDLVADSVADGLPASRRALAHARLADALACGDADPAEPARHLAAAGEHEPAAAAYLAAARRRLERHADAEAVALAAAGLALDPAVALTADLHAVRAEGRARRGAVREALDDLRAALRLGAAGPARARWLARQARLAAGADDLTSAEDLVGLALTEAGGDPAARADALYAGAIVDLNVGRDARARERSDEALRLYRSLGDARGCADILDARAMATCLAGRNREALDAFDRVARLFDDAGDLLRVITPRSTRGHGLVFLGRPEEGLDDCDEALERARALGTPDGIAYAQWHRGEALAALGRHDDAVEAAAAALATAEAIGHGAWTAAALRALGVAHQAAGALAAAERAFRDSLDRSRGWPLFTSWACTRLALVRLAVGDVDAAAGLAARALAVGPPLAHFEARLAQAEVAAARGRPDAAAVAERALALARDAGHLQAAPRLAALAGEGAADSV